MENARAIIEFRRRQLLELSTATENIKWKERSPLGWWREHNERLYGYLCALDMLIENSE